MATRWARALTSIPLAIAVMGSGLAADLRLSLNGQWQARAGALDEEPAPAPGGEGPLLKPGLDAGRRVFDDRDAVVHSWHKGMVASAVRQLRNNTKARAVRASRNRCESNARAMPPKNNTEAKRTVNST